MPRRATNELSSMPDHKDDSSCKKQLHYADFKISLSRQLSFSMSAGESFRSFVCVGVRKSCKIVISKSMLCNIQSPYLINLQSLKIENKLKLRSLSDLMF